MQEIKYNRNKAYEYAKKWAYSRNPKFYNFDTVGGDCTSYISQCIFEGIKTMNYTKNMGWYYINGNNKSPSWSGVEFLYNFLTKNKSIGPFGVAVEQTEIELGDIAQLSFDGVKFGHTLFITKIINKKDLNKIYVSSHTNDVFDKPIENYEFQKIRFIHIQGARKY